MRKESDRKASDRMAECIIDLLNEYKRQIDMLNRRIDYLIADGKEQEKKRIKAVEQSDDMSDKLGEIAEIIAGITDNINGNIGIYLSDIQPKDAATLKRLFTLLDIPMTEAEIKDGDTIDKD